MGAGGRGLWPLGGSPVPGIAPPRSPPRPALAHPWASRGIMAPSVVPSVSFRVDALLVAATAAGPVLSHGARETQPFAPRASARGAGLQTNPARPATPPPSPRIGHASRKRLLRPYGVMAAADAGPPAPPSQTRCRVAQAAFRFVPPCQVCVRFRISPRTVR